MPNARIVVIGNCTLDPAFSLPRFPNPGETLLATGASQDVGGKGANQAVAAARSGVDVSFCSAVGRDVRRGHQEPTRGRRRAVGSRRGGGRPDGHVHHPCHATGPEQHREHSCRSGVNRFGALGVSDDQRVVTDPPQAVSAFRDGMLSLAAHGTYEEILAGMAAAEWMYLTWSRTAHARRPSDPVCGEWIALHVARLFADQVAWLLDELDRLGAQLAPARQHRLAAAFRRTLILEIGFHDAPYAEAAARPGNGRPCS